MAGWTLAVDFGTSFTCAAISTDGPPEVLEIDNSRYLPSAVWLDPDGHLLTGRVALSQGEVFPERLERLPKRALVRAEQTRLGDTTLATVDLVAAVLRRVADEASRRAGGGSPDVVILTHPARWTPTDLDKLSLAAGKANLPAPVFIPEPVAAAAWYAAQGEIPLNAHVAVYDLGGGTLDTAVLRHTASGFTVAGAPGGDTHFGGEDIDETLRDLVGVHAEAVNSAAWQEIWADTSRAGRREQALVHRDIVTAKMALSENPIHTVFLAGFDDGLRVTRRELEDAVEAQLDASVDELRRTITAANIRPGDLSALCLTGGASRMPRVSELLAEKTGLLPRTGGDPKAVTVLGAMQVHLSTSVTGPDAETVTGPRAEKHLAADNGTSARRAPGPGPGAASAASDGAGSGGATGPAAGRTRGGAATGRPRVQQPEQPAPSTSATVARLVAARSTLRRLLIACGVMLVVGTFFLGIPAHDTTVWERSATTGVTILLAGISLIVTGLIKPESAAGRTARLTSVFLTLAVAHWHVRYRSHSHDLAGGSASLLMISALGGFVLVWLLEVPLKGWRPPSMMIAVTGGALFGAFVLWPGPGLVIAGLFLLSWVVTFIGRATREHSSPG